MREDREYYYNRKSLEDSMRNCVYCVIALVALAVACGVYQLIKWIGQ